MFAGLWFIHVLNTVLFIFYLLKKVMLQKRKYSGKNNEQSKAGNSFHTSCDLMGCPCVWGSHCKVLVAGWTAEVVSLSRCQKVPLCLIEPMSPGSKTDLPLETKPSCDDSSDSGIMYFRKGKNCWEQRLGENCENMWERQLWIHEGCEGRDGAGTEQRLPCIPWWASVLHGGPWWSRYLEDPLPDQVGYPKESMTPWEDHAGAGSWQNLWAHKEKTPLVKQFFLWP